MKIFKLKFLFILYLVIQQSNCASVFSANDIINLMNNYLDTHSIKSYYMTIDPNELLSEIDHKLLSIYQNILFDKYNIITLNIVANGLFDYGNGLESFLKNFYKEFNKTFNIQDLRIIVSVITVKDRRIIIDSSNKLKYIFNDDLLYSFKKDMISTLEQNHLFLTIYELLKNIENAQKKYIQKNKMSDL